MSHDAEMDAAMARIGVLRYRLEQAEAQVTDLKAKADQSEAENARLKESLRLQIEQNALAQVGFKMYQDNVDSGGLHKDRKDAIARLDAENARLKAEVERLRKELADAQENYHIVNEMVAKMLKEGNPQS